MELSLTVNTFMSAMDAIINTVFFFVIPTLLILFALSIFIVNITKIGNKWVKYTINFIYLAYVVLSITEIRDFVVIAKWTNIIAIVPFLCMVLVPAIAKQTEIGKYLLSYNAMMVYYIVFNAIWLIIVPTDGNIIIVLIYALIMSVFGQILQFYGDRQEK